MRMGLVHHSFHIKTGMIRSDHVKHYAPKLEMCCFFCAATIFFEKLCLARWQKNIKKKHLKQAYSELEALRIFC